MTAFWIVAVAASIAAAFIAGRISREGAEPLWFAPGAQQLRFYYQTVPPTLAAVMRIEDITVKYNEGTTMILRDESSMFQERMVIPFFTTPRGLNDEPQ